MHLLVSPLSIVSGYDPFLVIVRRSLPVVSPHFQPRGLLQDLVLLDHLPLHLLPPLVLLAGFGDPDASPNRKGPQGFPLQPLTARCVALTRESGLPGWPTPPHLSDLTHLFYFGAPPSFSSLVQKPPKVIVKNVGMGSEDMKNGNSIEPSHIVLADRHHGEPLRKEVKSHLEVHQLLYGRHAL